MCDLLTVYHTFSIFNNPVCKSFENIEGKEENTGNQQKKLLVTNIFSFSNNVVYPSQLPPPLQKKISIFQSHLFCCFQILNSFPLFKS